MSAPYVDSKMKSFYSQVDYIFKCCRCSSCFRLDWDTDSSCSMLCMESLYFFFFALFSKGL